MCTFGFKYRSTDLLAILRRYFKLGFKAACEIRKWKEMK